MKDEKYIKELEELIHKHSGIDYQEFFKHFLDKVARNEDFVQNAEKVHYIMHTMFLWMKHGYDVSVKFMGKEEVDRLVAPMLEDFIESRELSYREKDE